MTDGPIEDKIWNEQFLCVSETVTPFLPSSGFKYTKVNVPGKGAITEDFDLQFQGCDCHVQSCMPEFCSCLKNQGRNYDNRSLIGKQEDRPIRECNILCSCRLLCENRLVQFGLKFKLELFLTNFKGLGIRSLCEIPENSFVCEYAGEIISRAEAKKRLDHLLPSDPNYILAVDEHYGSNTEIITVVDPTFKGNLGRFINHSCMPNLRMEIVRVDIAIPKLCLFACNDISYGEELTYDYAGAIAGSDELSNKPCSCMSTNCRKYLPRNMSIINY